MEDNFIIKRSAVPSFSVNGADGYNFLIKNEKIEVDYIDSKTGHGGRVVSDLMTHIYYILEGEGDFEIDGNIFHASVGDLVEILPNHSFDYKGKMKMMLIMNPPFSADHIKHL